MTRRAALLALTALLSCQDYRFNPVGRCVLQPGQVRVAVADIHTADVLFVVDDSASMDPMQQALANSFQSFVSQLAAIQAARVLAGKPALDFYVAVATSAVFVSEYLGESCQASTMTCSRTAAPAFSYACGTAGELCGYLHSSYGSNACTSVDGSGCGCDLNGCGFPATTCCQPGSSYAAGAPYPAGSFVGTPRVLEFKGSYDWANAGTDPTIQGLIGQFKTNVKVGSCGSNQEMHFEASLRAVQKALAGQQGLPTGVQWPHDASKLVVVWIGNEDDCSTPQDPSRALVWDGAGQGNDSCVHDPYGKITPVSDYAGFFGGLGRPFGAAFIYPGSLTSPFTPGSCSCQGSPVVCGVPCGGAQGYDGGSPPPRPRFRALADAFRAQGASVVEDSICKADFGPTLTAVADLVKPPEGVSLPTAPAAGIVTQLRVITTADGRTVHICDPAAPASEWKFIDCGTGLDSPAGATSKCISLLASGLCVPAQGQTLVAEYLGRVPAEGCATTTDCANTLGGTAADWTCCAPGIPAGTCGTPSGSVRGTCACAAH